MVLNTWNDVKLICGNHGEDCTCEMTLREGATGKSPFYVCPRYVSIFSGMGGKSCSNNLSIKDYEKMLEKIMDDKYGEFGNELSAKGMRFTIKNIDFRVLEDNKEGIKVLVLNRKAILS